MVSDAPQFIANLAMVAIEEAEMSGQTITPKDAFKQAIINEVGISLICINAKSLAEKKRESIARES